MPRSLGPQERALAETVLQLLNAGELRVPLQGTFDVPLPADTAPNADPQSMLHFTSPLPDLLGHPTLTVEQSVEGATGLEIVQRAGRAPVLRCTTDGGQAMLVTRLVD